ncbi:MAG: MFS transporter [Candidatus Lokiarchaeota archaeon]|nr:MFS transporter [Candidatus Lokiarchaeota archaeon]
MIKKSNTKNHSDKINTPNELKSDTINSNEHEDKNNVKMTPDFIPMIRIIFWNSMGFFFFSFLIPYVTVQLLGVSKTELGIAFSIQTIGGLLSAPIVGFLTDRVSKKILILIGSFGRAICYILMYIGILVSSFVLFTTGMFILGFFVGFFWTPLDTLISEKSNKDNRSFAFGKRGGMIGKGNAMGSIISFIIFWLANTFVPEYTFLVYCPLLLFAASNILGGFVFHLKVDEELTFEKHIFNIFPSSVEPSVVSKKPVISDSPLKSRNNLAIGFFIGFSVLVLAFMTSNINQMLAYPYFQVYLIEELEVVDPTLVMIIYFPSQIISLLLAPKLGKIADKINPVLGMVFVSSLGAFVTWLIIGSTSGYMFGLLLLFDSTFAWGGNLILQNILSRISKIHRGKVFGAAQWLSLLGAVLGPIIGGFVYDSIGPSAPFVISIFIELSVIPLYAIAIKALKPYMAEKVDT